MSTVAVVFANTGMVFYVTISAHTYIIVLSIIIGDEAILILMLGGFSPTTGIADSCVVIFIVDICYAFV
jgi:hypothetical protein